MTIALDLGEREGEEGGNWKEEHSKEMHSGVKLFSLRYRFFMGNFVFLRIDEIQMEPF